MVQKKNPQDVSTISNGKVEHEWKWVLIFVIFHKTPMLHIYVSKRNQCLYFTLIVYCIMDWVFFVTSQWELCIICIYGKQTNLCIPQRICIFAFHKGTNILTVQVLFYYPSSPVHRWVYYLITITVTTVIIFNPIPLQCIKYRYHEIRVISWHFRCWYIAQLY